MANLCPISIVTFTASNDQKERVASLDQYRGFVILWSLIIPLLGALRAAPVQFKHNRNFFSFAGLKFLMFVPWVRMKKSEKDMEYSYTCSFIKDLTLGRLRAKKGIREVIIKQLRRTRTLYIIGLLIHNVGFQFQHTWTNLGKNWPQLLLIPIWNRGLFQTLTIIAIAQLIILPVITRPVWIRVCYMIGLITVYIVGQWTFFFKLQWTQVIDGGSFGAFSWALLMIAGTFLNDWNEWIRNVPPSNVIVRRRRVIIACIGLVFVAGVSWLLGYLVSSIPASWSPTCFSINGTVIVCPNRSLPSIPFVPPQVDVISMWTMSQRMASLSIQFTGLGYSLLVYLFWFVASDLNNLQFSFLKTLSTHSLLMFILRDLGFSLASSIIPNDSPLYMLPVYVLIGLSANVVIARYIESNNINLRI